MDKVTYGIVELSYPPLLSPTNNGTDLAYNFSKLSSAQYVTSNFVSGCVGCVELFHSNVSSQGWHSQNKKHLGCVQNQHLGG